MNERGDFRFGPAAGVVIIALALVGLFAVCFDDDDDEVDSLGRLELVSHEYDDGDRYRYEEDNGGYGDGRGGDGRFGGGRSGDYEGGDGDDCRNVCNNTFPMPGSGEDRPR